MLPTFVNLPGCENVSKNWVQTTDTNNEYIPKMVPAADASFQSFAHVILCAFTFQNHTGQLPFFCMSLALLLTPNTDL